MECKLLIDRSAEGKQSVTLPACDVPLKEISKLIPETYLRALSPDLPEVSEPEVVRHFVNLSNMNHHVDKGFYPLGSCTMKYNPKINEEIASCSCLTECHPLQEDNDVQGALKIYYDLERYLCEITGMHKATLQPSAGSHGELTGVMVMRAYHEKRNNKKSIVLLPDSAHGTNPASVKLGGYKALTVKSTEDGLVDLNDLREKASDQVAGLMLTNPNTLGLFEKNVEEIAEIIHGVDGIMYMDGANMNALMGIAKPGKIGFDITHLNLHKTMSTPHGGGGPGSGPIAVVEKLADFLPVPCVEKEGNTYHLEFNKADSIGKVLGFWGNFQVMVKAWAYIRTLGADGLYEASKHAIINANYIRACLEDTYELPFKGVSMHECVFSGDLQKAKGAKTLDIAKRLLDYGIHAPTVYFPLIVHEALMIEPTETESKETLDNFIAVMKKIDKEISETPELVTSAPHATPVRRMDEVKANRELNIRW